MTLRSVCTSILLYNTTEDHHKVALHKSINRSQRHKYGTPIFYLIRPA